MMLDAGVPPFIAPSGPAQSMVAAAGVAVVFNNIIDLLGYGVGQAPAASIIGNALGGVWGQDDGLSLWKLDIQINVGTAFATSNAATADFYLEGAPDTGTAGGYQPGTWEAFATTGPKAAAELVAATPAGLGVFRMAWPPAPPLTLRPRFMRMRMVVPTGTNFTAGTISGAFMVPGRDDLQSAMRAASNYIVA
jgi:hypothetical protein